MNAERLLAHFDRVGDAPDAVPRLRRLVLDLAVRGRLVEQDPDDEPASELLKRIAVERKERIDRGEVKRRKPAAPINNAPFELPPGWVWIRMSETGKIFSGNSINATTREQLKKTEKGRPFIATKDVGYGFEKINYENGLLVDFSEDRFKIARADSVLICAEGGSAGRKTGLTDRKICFGNKLLANETWSVISPKYVLCVYQSDFFYAQFLQKMTGVIGGISIRNFLQILFPLPPLAEQFRIVERADELMALCGRLDEARATRANILDRMTKASYNRLTAPDKDVAAFRSHARFIVDSLPVLMARVGQVKQLRQTILNLAVRGKLVERKEGEGDASALVEVVRFEREQAGRRARKPEMTLVDYSLPQHWAWQSLDEIITDGPQNGLSPRKSESASAPKAITLTATTSGTFDSQYFKNVDVRPTGAVGYWLEPGDLLFQRGNTRDYVGIAAIYDGPPNEFLFPDLIIRVKVSPYMSIRYTHLWCIAPFARNYLSSNATGAQKTMPKINQRILKATPVAIPPLAEQHRIVAKVDELMALCDRLEAGLATADAARRRLLESLLREALGEAA